MHNLPPTINFSDLNEWNTSDATVRLRLALNIFSSSCIIFADTPCEVLLPTNRINNKEIIKIAQVTSSPDYHK
jgi:hypothetical protein